MKYCIKFPDGDYVHGLNAKGDCTSARSQRLAVKWDDHDGADPAAEDRARCFARLIMGRLIRLKPKRAGDTSGEGKEG